MNIKTQKLSRFGKKIELCIEAKMALKNIKKLGAGEVTQLPAVKKRTFETNLRFKGVQNIHGHKCI